MIAWIGLHEPTEDEFEAVRGEFWLHELAVVGWRLGYPLVLAVIASICLLLYWRFRRVGWF